MDNIDVYFLTFHVTIMGINLKDKIQHLISDFHPVPHSTLYNDLDKTIRNSINFINEFHQNA